MLIKFSQAIVEVLYLKRIFMMYYDFDLQRKTQKKTFMQYQNLEIEDILHNDKSNVFIDQIKIFELNVNLSRTSVMILCKSTYDQKLND